MNDTQIVVATRMTREVFYDFGRFHNYRAFHRYLRMLLIPLFMFLLAFLNLKEGRPEFSVLVLILGILFPVISVLNSRRSLKSQMNQMKLGDTQGHVVYNIKLSEDGIDIQNRNEHLHIAWDKLLRAYILDQYCYLYILKNKAFILPYKNIQSGTMEELLELLENKLSLQIRKDYRKRL